MGEIIARDAELAAVRAVIDRPADGLTALVLEGEAGIGKSTVWQAGVTDARERDLRVLVARPAESERTLPNAVLGDLLGDLSPEVRAALPPPRRRAVEAALLLRDHPGAPVDPRAVGVAIVTLLPLLADGGRLVLAIDDDQWMDQSSAATLEFALRRLLSHPILLLLSRRLESGAATRLEELPDQRGVERIRLGPLSVGAIQLLLRQQLGISFARPMLVRIHEASGGNPFHALELARAQAADPTRDTTLPVAISTLDRLVDVRLQALGGATRRALLITAAHGRLPIELLAPLDVSREALKSALEANLIQRSSQVIRFTHPLLASAVYQGATDDERRAAHRRLAGAIADTVLRGRHLALGAEGPDDAIAAALESAAGGARDRGIPIAAAELAQHALHLTPLDSGEDRHRRAITYAHALFEAGEGARALALAADLRARAQTGRQRAEALILSAEVDQQRDAALAFLGEALLEAADAPELQAIIHAGLAREGRGARDLAWAEHHAVASLRLAERIKDDALRARALATLAPIRFDRGDPRAFGIAQRAYGLAAQVGDDGEMKRAGWSVGHMLTWSGLTDRAREWLESQLLLWGDRDEEVRWTNLGYLALVELWAGRWSLARQYAEQAQEISVQYGPEDHFALTFITLYQGKFTAARNHARIGQRQLGTDLIPAFPAALGICEMWSGHPAAALPYFGEAERMSDARNLDEPNNRWWRGEHVEALLQAGQTDAAERLLDDWDAAAVSLSRERVAAGIMRCRGLVAAARGDLPLAGSLLEQAVDRLAAAGDSFGRARAHLALGLVRRRGLQKRTARAALESALAGFEDLGAASWAAATRGELGRIGGRQRIEGLSPSELSVATLVAEGRTNREIAAALFLGERTVASHLTHIYSKLSLRSRTELARHLRSSSPASSSTSKVPTS